MKKTDSLFKLSAALLALLIAAGAAGCAHNPLESAIGFDEPLSSSSSSGFPTLSEASISSSGADSSSSSSDSSSSSESSSSSASSGSYSATEKDVQKRMLQDTIKYYELNKDTVAWLYIPGTTVNESVVRSPEANNDYYLRRTNLGVESTGKYSEGWYGCYYTDYRSILGSRYNLSKNLVIYGHSMTDNPDGARFAQLNKFGDIDFCRSHPYIYFSTIESEMVWQVFAVFYCRVQYVNNRLDTEDPAAIFNYNLPNPSNETFLKIVDEARQRSFFDFDVTVSAGDKILTLSTCTYNVVDVYPNDYRMVVMARLLPAGAVLSDTVKVTANADRVLPDEAATFAVRVTPSSASD